jgi:predicted Zn-dependent peptidase
MLGPALCLLLASAPAAAPTAPPAAASDEAAGARAVGSPAARTPAPGAGAAVDSTGARTPARTVGTPAPGGGAAVEPSATTARAADAAPRFTTWADDPLQVRGVTLANGLTVLLSVNRERPEVFGAVVVRTGGRNDPPEHTGMAHYLEHMLFKGTVDLGTTDWAREQPLQDRLEALYERKRAAPPAQRAAIDAEIAATVKLTYAYAVPNELDQMLAEIGGTEVNAFTTYDETVYHNTFPASQVDAWLEIYAHRFDRPVFRLFPTELEAVYEEKNTAIDTTGYELFRTFMRGAFPGHPYGRNDILGEVEHLRRPSLRAMRAYYERYYVPGNMALVLSGDLDPEALLPRIEALFGAWRPGPDPKPPAYPVAPFAVDQRLRARATPVRVGAVAFRTVPESHPDYAALLLARRLLSNEQRSGLIDRLSDEGKLLLAMHVPADLAETNLDVVAYIPRLLTQSFRGAERRVLAQFRRLADGEFEARTFAALRAGLLAAEATKWETNRARGLAIAHAFVARGGWGGYVEFLRELRALTPADVQRVAGELFGERRLVLRSRVGFPRKTRLDKPSVPAVAPRGGHSRFFAEMRARPKPPARVEPVDFAAAERVLQVRPGVTLRASGNPFNDLYDLELRFGVGEQEIRELDVLAQYLQRIGSEAHPGGEFRRRLFELSTTLTATAEPDRFLVRLHGPQAHMREAAALLAELMATPAGERRPLRQLRREIWALRRYERKNPPSVARALRDHVLYGDDAPQHRHHGPRGARRLRPRHLLGAWTQVQGREVEVGYVGREDPAAVARMVAELPLAAAPRPAVPHVVYRRRAPAETTIYFVPRRDAVQTQLWFAVEGDPVPAGERAAADAFAEYLGGGMGGLVFQEVREYRALAYAASARYPRDSEPAQGGFLLAHVGCQADKTFDALAVMLGLISRMPERPERLELVRSALVRSQETERPAFRELQRKITDWRRLGYDRDPRPALAPAYAALEFADIVEFYRRHVEGRPLAVMIVGDPRKARPAELKKLGKLVRLRERQLYSP